ncbi:sporulation integral membrane protein YtvI [Virgibacillus profundi]|uniref:Sporulation integral membrane protein YtvI n=1 Tax=Virgibacillus profundi TaxID=2024555 RepID=A0A2A2IGX4_9BACI|nr:sporulation integral membrane protein YtvI [Virgibacillus profundi]PAV30400.1 sporulation integral membrane protein YtvI [Virgibacillus profundi]PXY54572.1 sporulation integral membrane protein YtvI [Virgibacillus profundi]
MYKPLFYQLIRLLFVIVTILFIYFFAKYSMIYLFPILIAVTLSYFINPAVSFFENKLKFPRPIATITILVFIFSTIAGVIIFIIQELIQGTAYLAEVIPIHFHRFISAVEEIFHATILPFYHKIVAFFHSLDPSQQSSISDNIEQFTSNIASSGAALLQDLILIIPAILSALPNSVTVFMFIILATFFITNDWYSLNQTLKKIIPVSAGKSINHVFFQLKKALTGFIKAQAILISITAGIIFLGLLFLQVDHAFTIALMASAVDILPLIGTGIIFIPWIIYLFITANYSMTISLAILYMLIVVVRQLLEPKILSSSIGLNPLAALIALFLGIQLWGIVGLFLAPFLLVIINAFYQAGLIKQLWSFIKG